jgi:hypothetical protein
MLLGRRLPRERANHRLRRVHTHQLGYIQGRRPDPHDKTTKRQHRHYIAIAHYVGGTGLRAPARCTARSTRAPAPLALWPRSPRSLLIARSGTWRRRTSAVGLTDAVSLRRRRLPNGYPAVVDVVPGPKGRMNGRLFVVVFGWRWRRWWRLWSGGWWSVVCGCECGVWWMVEVVQWCRRFASRDRGFAAVSR